MSKTLQGDRHRHYPTLYWKYLSRACAAVNNTERKKNNAAVERRIAAAMISGPRDMGVEAKRASRRQSNHKPERATLTCAVLPVCLFSVPFSSPLNARASRLRACSVLALRLMAFITASLSCAP